MTTDPPYYQPTRDNRRVHVCTMPGHSRYWLNVGAKLWVCERCHPPATLGSTRRGVGDVALAEVWEIVPLQGPARLVEAAKEER